ncbi:MAG: hypothetical protein CSA22_06665 [Deltaproteobacteria bacterium]|nr:MAG: hypothetical protein CSA22_06665 [Deltaproteobacteria bacterium]
MFKVIADPKKNRLYLTLGRISSTLETEAIIYQIEKAVQQLTKGFTCLKDLREYDVCPPVTEAFMQDCQVILWDAQIGKTVRVCKNIAECDLFSFETKSMVWPAYDVSKVECMKEAEAILDSHTC